MNIYHLNHLDLSISDVIRKLCLICCLIYAFYVWVWVHISIVLRKRSQSLTRLRGRSLWDAIRVLYCNSYWIGSNLSQKFEIYEIWKTFVKLYLRANYLIKELIRKVDKSVFNQLWSTLRLRFWNTYTLVITALTIFPLKTSQFAKNFNGSDHGHLYKWSFNLFNQIPCYLFWIDILDTLRVNF